MPSGDLARWDSHPLAAEVRDGFLYGRGANDMKGAIAAFVHVLECLRAEGVRLRGDVVVAANTDEESNGAGSLRVAERGVKADAGICGEPTGFDVWVACRGTLNVRDHGTGTHGARGDAAAGLARGRRRQRHREARARARAIRALREDWRVARTGGTRSWRRPTSSPPCCAPGSGWSRTRTARC